jgi:hypothetical protein
VVVGATVVVVDAVVVVDSGVAAVVVVVVALDVDVTTTLSELFAESAESDFGLSAPITPNTMASPIATAVTITFVFFVQSGFIHTSATPMGQQQNSPMMTTAMWWYHWKAAASPVVGGGGRVSFWRSEPSPLMPSWLSLTMMSSVTQSMTNCHPQTG